MSTGVPRVAVIGAGAAGAMLARSLQQRGLAVEVFDKARGPGGRMATRRQGAYAFDHGAQYFTLRDPRLTRLSDDWVKAGVIAPWQPSEASMEAPRWVAVPGMNALARHLLSEVTVHWRAAITALERDDGGWRLHGDQGVLGEGFDQVALALPAPQARSLLAGLGGWDQRLAEVIMAPCWAVMLADFVAPPPPGPRHSRWARW
ncbi:MAG: NAD(P)-binding protein [Gammaproteobacteria bacterium]|nr:NAD(P)-binding protein [Gammaproteobacteria bacterium]